MTHLGKLKQLIETIKVSNEVMKRQLDLNGRTLDLLGSLIIEPESLGCPFDEPLKPIEPTNIKPEDMISGEWYHLTAEDYVGNFIFKFKNIDERGNRGFHVYHGCNYVANHFFPPDNLKLGFDPHTDTLRKATREEVTRYFPHEFEIPTHGGNDVPNIPQFTDEQL